MPARHRSRQRALQVLFSWDLRKQPVDDAIAAFYKTLDSEEEDPNPEQPDEFMETLVRGATDQAAAIDQRIAAKSEHWRLDRMPAVDRNILRLAVYEMSDVGTPAPVVIDEALELARKFSTDESVAFINGVLDAVRRDASMNESPARGSGSPAQSLNIGAAARAMSNFGCTELRLVNPYEVAFREARSAVKAHKVLEKAREYRDAGRSRGRLRTGGGHHFYRPSRAGTSAAAAGAGRQADRAKAGQRSRGAAVWIGEIRAVE